MTTATFLGTGTSVGVPVIGCDCPVCTSSDRRNRRTRCALHLQSPGLSLLIDTGPDLRAQALRENLRVVDAVLYTHAHLDHVAGFDELRAFCWRRDEPLPLYGGPNTLDSLRRMFPWAIENRERSYIRPVLRQFDGPFPLADLAVTPVPVDHAGIETFGFRFALPDGSSLAYLCDVKAVPEASLALLAGLDVLILDALKQVPHPTHLSLAESLALVDALRPQRAVFTHLAHEIEFVAISASLPDRVFLAQDGLRLLFQDQKPCVIVEPSNSGPK